MSKFIKSSLADGVNMFLHQCVLSNETAMFLAASKALISSVPAYPGSTDGDGLNWTWLVFLEVGPSDRKSGQETQPDLKVKSKNISR